MPVDWPFAGEILRLQGAGPKKIGLEDAIRQEETARSILAAFKGQPGVILADEVGMGKTYVALAVITSVILSTKNNGNPVVVMVPPGLLTKWKREWDQFKRLCCLNPRFLQFPTAFARNTSVFFDFLGDPKKTRPRLIWMTTATFFRSLNDPWIKLAIIRMARSYTRLSASTKKRLCKWATSLVRGLKSKQLNDYEVEWLLDHKPSKWSAYLKRVGFENTHGIIPKELLRKVGKLNKNNFSDWQEGRVTYKGLTTLLRDGTIPGWKPESVARETERYARDVFNRACQRVYKKWLRFTNWHSPLLVLDEAHHAKNDDTRLAGLFRHPGDEEDVALLQGKFERMLFLTATPFQLGHQELVRVLRSFAAVNWTGSEAPCGTLQEFTLGMDKLEERLDRNRLAARRLDRLWGRLDREKDLDIGKDQSLEAAAENWWRRFSDNSVDLNPFEREIIQAVEECKRTRECAEVDPEHPWQGLRPWVIRHNRPTSLNREGEPYSPRRNYLFGRSIEENTVSKNSAVVGINIEGRDSLPFLIAARAQGELAAGSTETRALFAEGLCSSYEAFHHTREKGIEALDGEEKIEENTRRTKFKWKPQTMIVPVEWYEEQIQNLIPSLDEPEKERYRHPKIRAVVDRTVKLWEASEKVLIFCHYRKTAEALRDHLRREVQAAALKSMSDRLGPALGSQVKWSHLLRIAQRLRDPKSPWHQEILQLLHTSFSVSEFSGLREHEDRLVSYMTRYVCSPTFVARYLPWEEPEVKKSLIKEVHSLKAVRAGIEALRSALDRKTDASGTTITQRFEEFLKFAQEKADLGKAGATNEEDREEKDPLTDYMDAVEHCLLVQEGTESGEDLTRRRGVSRVRIFPVVQMVYGSTKRDLRERLMLGFNSPLFPEILISSPVLGEGVDLHRFCRFVIHHDLDWNPSILEQRIGRLDRISCKAELVGQPIVVFEPFLAGSADEKMFRVVRDRERWFQIVMGQRFEFDEATSDRLAQRVPLPESLASKLVFDLRRSKG